MDTVRRITEALLSEARPLGERRGLFLTGTRAATCRAAETATAVVDGDVTVVSEATDLDGDDHLPPGNSGELLGTTRSCVVVDCHDACEPNVLGRAVGAVDGGGLLVVRSPPLASWPDRLDGYDSALTPPPFDPDSARGLFRRWLVETIRAHRGIAIVDADSDTVCDDGLVDPPPRRPAATGSSTTRPEGAAFPPAAYEACRTADQRDAVAGCEALRDDGTVVLEAHRGRGKSSAAGLAAGALAADGRDVLVTAPNYRNAAPVFDRAAELLAELDALASDDRDGNATPKLTTTDGSLRFRVPPEAAEERADVLVVDEAAALPVSMLRSLLAVAPAACFSTTLHGYEGSGRGFDVRFREQLESRRDPRTIRLSEPIRYAAGDPLEVWAFRALLLDARPPVAALVAGATPEAATYERVDPETLLESEHRLRETFGLLLDAHYRTEPNDLARLLDGPNVSWRVLSVDDRPVSVAVVAREGDLPQSLRRRMYEGERVRGNMLPDVLTSQLRDPEAAKPQGLRVMRIATHAAVRSRGFGSRLLSELEAEFGREGVVDYLGVGFGATPDLVSFWAENGYTPVHLSRTVNDTSGERSVLMLDPVSEAGTELADRHTAWFRRRIVAALSDPLSEADPETVRAVLEAGGRPEPPSLSDAEWRLVASAAYGPGLFDVSPRPFRELAVRAIADGIVSDSEATLLVRKVLQATPTATVADELGYHSTGECMRTLGETFRPIVDRYGGAVAEAEADRYRE